MASMDKEKLSDYESMRQRNVDNNQEILRYLNLQEVVDLESEGSGANGFGSDTDNTRPKKKYRKSPLPPTRPKSQRLREREKRLQEGQRNEPIIPPDYYDQFELTSRKVVRNNPTLQTRDNSRHRDNRHHFLHHHLRHGERVNNNNNNNSDEGVELIGKKYIIITFLLILIATSEWYKSAECCRRTVSRMIFNGVITILVVNLVNIIFFSKKTG